MTIDEAKNKWKVSHNKICDWLDAGIIPDVQVIDRKINIPDIELLIPQKGTKITIKKVREYIMKAIIDLKYIDYRILAIEPEKFRAILEQLETSGYVIKEESNADYLSNRGFITTEVGEDKYTKKKMELKKLNFELGFKYDVLSIKVESEFEREK